MLLKAAILFLMCLSLLSFFELKSEASPDNSVILEIFSNNLSADEREIFNLVNKQRRKKSLADMQWSDDLERLARSYSRKMADGRFFSHYERNGDSIIQRASAMKIKGWRKIGENLFYSEPYEKLNRFAVEKWMESPTHRQNILDRDYNTTGIGIAEAKDGTIYITQIFTQN